jgi:cation transport regulator ChaC
LNDNLAIFAYGSLMSEPVCPHDMIDERLATLDGFKRTFHKVSWIRGCHPSDAILPVEKVPARFVTQERHLSLVLGLEPNAQSKVVGYLQIYPHEASQRVLESLDAREGYNPSRPNDQNAYMRGECTVMGKHGKTFKSQTYFTNPRSDWVIDDLSLEEQAAILASATPKPVDGKKARGLFYLEGVRDSLRLHHHHDENLEGLSRCAYKWYLGRLDLRAPEP